MQVPVNVLYDTAYQEIRGCVRNVMATRGLNSSAMGYVLSRIQTELAEEKADNYAAIIMQAMLNQEEGSEEVQDDNADNKT